MRQAFYMMLAMLLDDRVSARWGMGDEWLGGSISLITCKLFWWEHFVASCVYVHRGQDVFV